MTRPHSSAPAPHALRTARVLRVKEDVCEVWRQGRRTTVPYAPMFPTRRVERVSPGHLVALATGPRGDEVVVWRWYDAVVLDVNDDGTVRLWEPAHGEVVAQARPSYQPQEPGSRAYASAGLPGAEWWVVAPVTAASMNPAVELDAVDTLYTDNDMWAAVFGSST